MEEMWLLLSLFAFISFCKPAFRTWHLHLYPDLTDPLLNSSSGLILIKPFLSMKEVSSVCDTYIGGKDARVPFWWQTMLKLKSPQNLWHEKEKKKSITKPTKDRTPTEKCQLKQHRKLFSVSFINWNYPNPGFCSQLVNPNYMSTFINKRTRKGL